MKIRSVLPKTILAQGFVNMKCQGYGALRKRPGQRGQQGGQEHGGQEHGWQEHGGQAHEHGGQEREEGGLHEHGGQEGGQEHEDGGILEHGGQEEHKEGGGDYADTKGTDAQREGKNAKTEGYPITVGKNASKEGYANTEGNKNAQKEGNIANTEGAHDTDGLQFCEWGNPFRTRMPEKREPGGWSSSVAFGRVGERRRALRQGRRHRHPTTATTTEAKERRRDRRQGRRHAANGAPDAADRWVWSSGRQARRSDEAFFEA